MANLGIGLGAFLNGVASGAKVYSDIQDSKSKAKVRDAQLKELEQSTADKDQYRSIMKTAANDAANQRQQAIASQVSQGVDQGTAEKQVGSYIDYWKNTAAPKLVQHWTETGDIEKAQNFEKWLEDSNVQAGMKNWANMARSFSVGDRPGFLKNLNATLTQSGYYDGSLQPIDAKEKVNDKGQLVGYTVNFKDRATGKESSQDFDAEDIQKLAVTGLSPDQVYSMGVDELRAAQKARAEQAKTADERQWEVKKLGIQQDNALEKDSNASQLRLAEEAEKKRRGLTDPAKDPMAKAKATEAYLRSKGYSEDFIKSNAPALVGIQNQSKPMANRIEDFIKTQTENDREFRKLPLAKKIEQAQEYIGTVDAATSSGDTAPPQDTQQEVTTPQKGRTLFWDNKTNSPVYR